jgi:hypothetical protein
MMKILICIAYLVLATPVVAQSNSQTLKAGKPSSCKGHWAASGCSAFSSSEFKTKKVLSPSRRFSINGTPDGILFNNGSTPPVALAPLSSLDSAEMLYARPLTEIVWSPNSQSFAVDASEGGNVGTYETAIYTINNALQLNRIIIDPEVHIHMMQLQRCDPLEPERPNLGVVGWLAKGSEILLVAEVPPHSSCKNMGALLGFRIAATTGSLIDKVSEPVLRKKYKHLLGTRFVGYQNSKK